MTSSLHRNFRSRAFTLIELMVVIGLIVLLIAIAIPMVTRAHRASMRTAMAADLAILAQGLEAYRADFGDYPRRTASAPNTPPLLGAELLCWALLAPGPVSDDGADGPGFRTRGVTGAVKGPYVPADRFTIMQFFDGAPMSPPPVVFSDKLAMFVDRYQHPILYFPANKAADPYAASVPDGAYVNKQGSALATFNYSDNNENPGGMSTLNLDLSPNKLSREVMCWRLGATGKLPPDGTLRPTDAPVTTGPFLLWSSGNDGIFGSNDDVANAVTDLQLNTTSVPSSSFGNKDPNPNIQ